MYCTVEANYWQTRSVAYFNKCLVTYKLFLFKPRVSIYVKGKVKSLDTCYNATYMSQTRDQQRFTISEVAADWHEPLVPQHIMWPSIAHAKDS